MRFLKLFVCLVIVITIALFALAFITHNQLHIDVDLLIWEAVEAPVYLWLVGSFIVGGLFGLLFSSALIIKERGARLRAERRLQSTSKMMSGYIS